MDFQKVKGCRGGDILRKRIFKMIEVAEDNDRISSYYDIFMMITIIASLLPLTTKSQNAIWNYIDMITVVIIIADYLLRLMTSDYKLGKGMKKFRMKIKLKMCRLVYFDWK